jgi:hypothetical protein
MQRLQALAAVAMIACAHVLAQDEGHPLQKCLSESGSAPSVRVLDGKVALYTPRDTTFDMLILNRSPNREEQAAIATWGRARHNCFTNTDYRLDREFPRVQAEGRAFEVERGLIADLHNGALTFGAFNRERQSAFEKARREIDAALERNYERERSRNTTTTDERRREAPPPSTPAANFDRDDATCKYEVQSTLAGARPPAISAPGAGQFQAGVEALGSTIAARQRADSLYIQCMRAKGWN